MPVSNAATPSPTHAWPGHSRAIPAPHDRVDWRIKDDVLPCFLVEGKAHEPVKHLGSGGNADAFLYERIDKPGAYIVIKRGLAENLRTEARIYPRLPPHPNVLKCLAPPVRVGELVHLALEFCENGDLHEMINRTATQGKKFSEGQVKVWMRQLVSGVQALHHCNFVIGDLKPANLLLTASNTLKLSDFGTAHELQPGELFRCTRGTVIYASPERVLWQADRLDGMEDMDDALAVRASGYRFEDDVWSVGVILRCLLMMKPTPTPRALGNVPDYALVHKRAAHFNDPERIIQVVRTHKNGTYLSTVEHRFSADAQALLKALLAPAYDAFGYPLRLNISQVARHPYLQTPPPTPARPPPRPPQPARQLRSQTATPDEGPPASSQRRRNLQAPPPPHTRAPVHPTDAPERLLCPHAPPPRARTMVCLDSSSENATSSTGGEQEKALPLGGPHRPTCFQPPPPAKRRLGREVEGLLDQQAQWIESPGVGGQGGGKRARVRR